MKEYMKLGNRLMRSHLKYKEETMDKEYINDFDISIISDPHVLDESLIGNTESLKKEWKNYNNGLTNVWHDFCIKHGIMPVILDTKYEPLQVLNQTFALKGQGR